jgi:hypothetical protein
MRDQHAADSLRTLLQQLREALDAVANGDSRPMKMLCSHGDSVCQCGIWSGVESEPGFLMVSDGTAHGVFLERW